MNIGIVGIFDGQIRVIDNLGMRLALLFGYNVDNRGAGA